MSIFTKTLPVPVRDIILQSVRRAPTSHSNGYNGDSLRRLVLQRNTLAAAMDLHDTNPPVHCSLRRLATDITSPSFSSSDGRQNQVIHRSSTVLRKSRSVQQLPVSSGHVTPCTQEELLEDAWFDRLFDDLLYEDMIDDGTNDTTNSSICRSLERVQ